jgi:hypothetical protein
MPLDRRAAAWSLFAAAVLAWAGAIGIALPRTTVPLRPEDMLWGLSFLALAAVGAIVVSQRSTNVFGWLLLLAPLLVGIGVLGSDYVGRVAEGAPWPGAAWAGLAGNVTFMLGMGLLALAMFRFPDGTTLGPWWRRIELVMIAVTGAGVLGGLTSPVVSEQLPLPNPLVGERMAAAADVLATLSELILVGGLLSIASLFVRYRRGGPRVRAQLRWVLYPAAVGVTVVLVTLALARITGWDPGEGPTGIIVTVIFTVGLPAGILAAISREQLYDIDRLISRTVAYAIVTAVLLVVYATVAVVPVVAFGLVGDVPVAIATLAAAAAFQPVRVRVQGRVDRRFHRRRYDAQRVVERFGEGLRDEVDLASVSAAACRAATEAVQPVHVALWLPAGAGR